MNFSIMLGKKDNERLIRYLKKNGFKLGKIDRELFLTDIEEGYIKRLAKGEYGYKRSIAITIREEEDGDIGIIYIDRGDNKQGKLKFFKSFNEFQDALKEALEEL